MATLHDIVRREMEAESVVLGMAWSMAEENEGEPISVAKLLELTGMDRDAFFAALDRLHYGSLFWDAAKGVIHLASEEG